MVDELPHIMQLNHLRAIAAETEEPLSCDADEIVSSFALFLGHQLIEGPETREQ
jgi:hypothetical protein